MTNTEHIIRALRVYLNTCLCYGFVRSVTYDYKNTKKYYNTIIGMDFDCLLGSSTDNAGPSTALASATDFDSSLGSSTDIAGPSTALA